MFPVLNKWIGYFILLFLYRYTRLIVNFFAVNFRYSPIPIPEKLPGSDQVTFILPTLANDTKELLDTIESALKQQPALLILVTPKRYVARLEIMMKTIPEPARTRIKIVCSEKANKRQQIVCALAHVDTPYTLLIDDDVLLPPAFLDWCLAPFATNEKVGGVGTNQRLRLKLGDRYSSCIEFLGDVYLRRRNFDCTACNYMDGGLPCLSGRAVMYKSSILKNQEFMTQYTHETWRFMGDSHILNADDDNCITRWLFSHDYKIVLQNHPDCEVQTTLALDWKFMHQCVRWQRSNWRSNLTSLFSEGNVWWLFPWSTYAVFLTTVTQWAFAIDATLVYLLYRITQQWAPLYAYIAFSSFIMFWISSKLIKFLGCFKLRDFFLYGWLLLFFGYFHNGIKLFSLLTIYRTNWGSRDDADSGDSNRERLRRVKP